MRLPPRTLHETQPFHHEYKIILKAASPEGKGDSDWINLNMRSFDAVERNPFALPAEIAEVVFNQKSSAPMLESLEEKMKNLGATKNTEQILFAILIEQATYWRLFNKGQLEFDNPYLSHLDRYSEFQMDGKDGEILDCLFKTGLSIKATVDATGCARNTVRETLRQFLASIRNGKHNNWKRCMDFCDHCSLSNSDHCQRIASGIRKHINSASYGNSKPGPAGSSRKGGVNVSSQIAYNSAVTTDLEVSMCDYPTIKFQGLEFPAHRLIWIRCNGVPVPPHHHIHHIDNDIFNNDISNLMCIPEFLHYLIHGKCVPRKRTPLLTEQIRRF